jgi:hypothetical protein
MHLALRPFPVIALVAASALALSACGSETSDTATHGAGASTGTAPAAVAISAVQLERAIVTQFAGQGIPLHDVRCGKVAPAGASEAGIPVRCTARNPSSTKLFIEGSYTPRTARKGHLEAKVVRGVAEGAVFAEQIEAKVEEQAGVEIEDLTCPKSFELPTATPVRCIATVAGGERHEITLSVDAKGETSLEFDTKSLSRRG